MTKIINAADVSDLESRKILFDTNIWILIEGLNGNSQRQKQDIYTNAWSALRDRNTIVVNEYIISEFCNRSVKIEYEFKKNSSDNPAAFPKFKDFRGSNAFKDAIEIIKDTCLNILEDCEFCSCYDKHFRISDAIEEYAQAKMDLSDIIIRSHCAFEGYMIMTDDRDYALCGLELITANRHLLANHR